MKTPPSNRSEKFFALLLRFYPRADREEYGDPMLQHFRDLRRDAQAAGFWPTLCFWIAIFLDTAASVAKARLAEAAQNITGKKFAASSKTVSFRKAFVGFLPPLLAGVALYIYAQPKMYVGLTRLACPHPVYLDSANPTVPLTPYFFQTQFAILNSDFLFESTISQLSLTDSLVKRAGGAGRDGSTATAVKFLRRRVSIQQHRNTALIEIRVTSESSTEAAAIANQLAESYTQTVRHNRSIMPAPDRNSISDAARAYEIWQMNNNDGITILDRAQPGLQPVFPNIPLLVTLGTLISITLATIGAAFLRIALRLKPSSAST